MTTDDEPLHRALGLTDEEAASIEEILGRPPNPLELAMYAVMWSEHCSYKSSRLHLRRLPTEGPGVLVGPGENAGVVAVGEGIAAAIRIESHNHPSYIEPHQGAATGVGGILRDVFTMGARPIAIMDPLRFGPLEHPRSRWVAEGVVSGISAYGNSVGVPTVGGEVDFDPTYRSNPLVNVLCLGLLPADQLVLGRASGPGNLAVLLGAATGRDGIGGVSVLASAPFDDADDASKRPSVQVGDPYEEKRLIEACLEMLERRLVVGIQDLGGAGLTCATSETASRAGTGMDVHLSEVPLREPDMEPFEIMTSESQERMLAIVEPADLDAVLEIADRWEVRAAVVGVVTDTGTLRVLDRPGGRVLAEVPAASLHDAAPCYDRPRRAPDPDTSPPPPPPRDPAGDLVDMVADTAWIWTQYDHQLFCNTVVGPGGDATVLRLRDPRTWADTGRALALTTDGNHRWCAVDPRRGTAAVVAEAVMNLACVGARPVALVNCLNFGNPTDPVVMWQLSEAVDGMAGACRAFGIPVVGGNVSLYNETAGTSIDPTPVVGLLGVLDRLEEPPPGPRLAPGCVVAVVGDGPVSLAGSRWAWRRGWRGGSLPEIDPARVAAVAELLRRAVTGSVVAGVHDIADGGLALAVAEMAVSSGWGAVIRMPDDADHTWLFGEGPGRAVVAVDPARLVDLEELAGGLGVPVTVVGEVAREVLRFETTSGRPVIDLALGDVVDRWERTLPEAFAARAAHD